MESCDVPSCGRAGRAVGGYYFIFLLDSSALHTVTISGVSKGRYVLEYSGSVNVELLNLTVTTPMHSH